MRAHPSRQWTVADRSSKSLSKALTSHAAEHYPASSTGVYPTQDDSAIALLSVANKYSLNNFWYVVQDPNGQ